MSQRAGLDLVCSWRGFAYCIVKVVKTLLWRLRLSIEMCGGHRKRSGWTKLDNLISCPWDLACDQRSALPRTALGNAVIQHSLPAARLSMFRSDDTRGASRAVDDVQSYAPFERLIERLGCAEAPQPVSAIRSQHMFLTTTMGSCLPPAGGTYLLSKSGGYIGYMYCHQAEWNDSLRKCVSTTKMKTRDVGRNTKVNLERSCGADPNRDAFSATLRLLTDYARSRLTASHLDTPG